MPRPGVETHPRISPNEHIQILLAGFMSSATRRVVLIVVIAAACGAAFLWWNQSRPAPQIPKTPEASTSAPLSPDSPAAKAPAPPLELAPQYPVEVSAAAPLEAAGIGAALTALLGRKAVISFFQLENFAHRFVATLDGLGRSHAPPMLWPINPTPDRFLVEEREGGPVIGTDNGSRYTPLVLLAEAVDTRRAVDLYISMYPLLQRAYEELGFPKRYFNDRLVAVIDQLLATPVVTDPVKVKLTEVKGSVPSVRPWVRYEFADPALESRSAGQKILLRVGSVNEHRLKAKLTAVRKELLTRLIPR